MMKPYTQPSIEMLSMLTDVMTISGDGDNPIGTGDLFKSDNENS